MRLVFDQSIVTYTDQNHALQMQERRLKNVIAKNEEKKRIMPWSLWIQNQEYAEFLRQAVYL